MTESLLAAEDLVKRFPLRAHPLGPVTGWIEAVKGVSLTLKAGETVGLVGESGCGKSTLARMLCLLVKPTRGSIQFRGCPAEKLRGEPLRAFRRSVQMIFQDPFASLDPLMRMGQIVAEPLAIHDFARGKGFTRGQVLRERVEALLKEVGLDPAFSSRLPSALSGGERQRVGIARALSLDPELLICDEPVSSLDLSVQAQILRLLVDLQSHRRLTLLFISHNLATVSCMADRILVMREGQIVEEAPNPQLFLSPQHPYTKQLVGLVPSTI